jgi:hypothetical protein
MQFCFGVAVTLMMWVLFFIGGGVAGIFLHKNVWCTQDENKETHNTDESKETHNTDESKRRTHKVTNTYQHTHAHKHL